MKRLPAIETMPRQPSGQVVTSSSDMEFRNILDAIRNNDTLNAHELVEIVSLATDKLNALYMKGAVACYTKFLGQCSGQGRRVN